MLALERRNLILERVHTDGKVIVSQLSKEFEVSEETIRRDLEKLEEEGHVTKSYGGAVENEKNNIELPFNVRKAANPEGKKRIAELVLSEVEEGDHILLDASTTAVFIARELKGLERLTIITNSIENIVELSDVKGWDIYSTGGSLNGNTMALLGTKAAEGILSYNADKAFFSCKALSMEKGLTDGNQEIANIKRIFPEAAGTVYLAVDHTKFDSVAFSGICDFSQIDVVITDRRPSEEWLRFFAQNEVRCVYPQD